MLQDGGRIGFRGGDAAKAERARSGKNTTRADERGSVDRNPGRGGDTSNFIDPDPEVNISTRNRQDTITSFPKNLSANIRSNPFSVLTPIGTGIQTALQTNKARKMLGYISPTTANLDNNINNRNIEVLPLWAQLGFNSEAEYLASLSPPEEELYTEEDEGLRLAFRADGGIMNNDVVGGEMDFESARQMYGLGKLVKKVTKTVKKIAKSPIGKVAIAAGLSGIPFGGGSFFGSGSLFGKAKPFLTDAIFGKVKSFGTPLEKGFGVRSGGLFDLIKKNPFSAITAASAVAGLLTAEQEEEAQQLADNTGFSIEEARNSILARAKDDYKMDFRARGFRAEGGIMRAGYQEGSKEPVAKKTMPLLDMGGKEMDLREDGGFVPLGRMEKADDVPARLSKNEFVFTADAVRNAGDGNVDKGAEVMYNMMKNLESGGDVSEESQGLEGARKMFQTSQRLEEVI